MSPLQRALLRWYRRDGRAHLPWRTTRDPYRVLVSELMLQQTQVSRVLPKYEAFVAAFPDFAALARAGIADVLRKWKGLGYNSRAVRLRELAKEVSERYAGRLPHDEAQLRSLPGIGPYTVAAVRAFSFEIDDAAVDTNVARIVHRVRYGIEFPQAAARAQLDAQAHSLVPHGRAHDWNSAMMDLGSSICTARAPKCLLCPLRAHCAAAPVDAAELEARRRRHAPRRSPQERLRFEESTRFVRGRIIDRLRDLPPGKRISLLDLQGEIAGVPASAAFDVIVTALQRDGLIDVREQKVALAE